MFDTIYVTFILCLQYVLGLQCLSIVLLIIYFIVFSTILRSMKEKSEAFLFTFDYASMLLVAILNLVLAVREVSKSQPTNNNDRYRTFRTGKNSLIIIAVNSCVNILVEYILSRIYTIKNIYILILPKMEGYKATNQTQSLIRCNQCYQGSGC